MISEPKLGRRIAGGDQAEVFECGQTVCKLYRPHIPEQLAKHMAFREEAALKIVEAFDDVPAPRAPSVRQARGRWGVIMDRIEGQSFACSLRDHPEAKPEYMKAMARLHVAIHQHQAPGLPACKAWLGDEIQKAGIKLGAALPMQALLNRLAEMPDSDWLCHGDFHPSNVMGTPRRASAIDWPHATRGEPAVDVCQSWLLMQRGNPELASDYVEAYVAYANEGGRRLVRNDILRWSPVVACARLADNVPDEVDKLKAIAVEGLAQ
jgi:aminoglycoside phosphotransferase (APT) family kinase protein